MGTRRSKRVTERRGRADVEDIGFPMIVNEISGARPSRDLETMRRILNLIREAIGSQCMTSVI